MCSKCYDENQRFTLELYNVCQVLKIIIFDGEQVLIELSPFYAFPSIPMLLGVLSQFVISLS